MEALGDDREAERDRLVLHQSPRRQHRPGEHDVLTDRIGPPADRTQVARPVHGECALSDERRVIRGLHALHAVDPEAVVPLLHPGDEGRHRVFRDKRGGARRYVLPLWRAGDANHESCERLRVQMRVGIDCHHERRRDGGEGCVQCVVLALLRFKDTSVVESKALTRCVCKLGCVVGRVVVGDDDFNLALVGEVGDVFQSALDSFAFVPRGDEDRHRWPLAFGPVALRRIEREFLVARNQEREDHEADDEAGDVSEEERNHPAHDGAYGSLKLASPWLGHPDAERHPRERQCEGDGETNRGPQARGRRFAPRTATESLVWREADDRISIRDRDFVIDRGQRRRGSS